MAKDNAESMFYDDTNGEFGESAYSVWSEDRQSIVAKSVDFATARDQAKRLSFNELLGEKLVLFNPEQTFYVDPNAAFIYPEG